MQELMQDPVFYGLMWAVFTVAGIIMGWTLRANTAEKDVRNTLVRVEQEKNTLARLYTHIKHQHDLREADFKRATLEVTALKDQVLSFESVQRQYDLADQQNMARLARAEHTIQSYVQKVSTIELLNNTLKSRNTELSTELSKLNQELNAWQKLYKDFQSMQQRMADFQQNAAQLEASRDTLKSELEAARIEIENLQLDLVTVLAQQLAQKQRKSGEKDNKGGRAAPEIVDDLKTINGITPFHEQQLNTLGIFTFEQISKWSNDNIIAFSKALQVSPAKIYQDDWVGQARHLTA